jgi:hypothetical protein
MQMEQAEMAECVNIGRDIYNMVAFRNIVVG